VDWSARRIRVNRNYVRDSTELRSRDGGVAFRLRITWRRLDGLHANPNTGAMKTRVRQPAHGEAYERAYAHADVSEALESAGVRKVRFTT